jgi:hypothetical protein
VKEKTMSHWIMGILAAGAALTGLFMSGSAQDAGIFWFGLTLFVFGVLFSWWMIKIAFDEREAYRAWLAAPVDPRHGPAPRNGVTSANQNERKAA